MLFRIRMRRRGTKTFSYAVDSNPMKVRVSEVTGSSTVATVSTLNSVGSLVSYTDGFGFLTERVYDQNSRPTTVTFKRSDGTVIGSRGVTYDAANRRWRELVDGVVVSTVSFNGLSEPTLVSYGNGTSLVPGRDGSGRATDAWFRAAGGGLLTRSQVTRSRSGRVVQEWIDGVRLNAGAASDYVYDGAGRLVTAFASDGKKWSFGFSPLGGGCPVVNPNAAAGGNGNRTSMTVTNTVSAAVLEQRWFCYDMADRLQTSGTGAVPGAAGLATFTYDDRGNGLTADGTSFTYDQADRHVGSTRGVVSDRVMRDSEGRVMSRVGGFGDDEVWVWWSG